MEETLKIIYENNDYMVIDKPSGLVVNRSNTSSTGTLQDMLDASTDIEDSENLEAEETEFTNRSGIVHRLDKGTSGVLVVAKNEDTFKTLQKQFKERQTSKVYIALIYGEIEESLIEIDAPIKRHPASHLKLAVVSDGKPALTRVEKLKIIEIEGNKYTLLKIMPKTGRTHQIRVHLAAINHPIVGDEIYAPNSLLEKSRNIFSRLMLHANILGFYYGKNNQYVEYISSIPDEFQI